MPLGNVNRACQPGAEQKCFTCTWLGKHKYQARDPRQGATKMEVFFAPFLGIGGGGPDVEEGRGTEEWKGMTSLGTEVEGVGEMSIRLILRGEEGTLGIYMVAGKEVSRREGTTSAANSEKGRELNGNKERERLMVGRDGGRWKEVRDVDGREVSNISGGNGGTSTARSERGRWREKEGSEVDEGTGETAMVCGSDEAEIQGRGGGRRREGGREMGERIRHIGRERRRRGGGERRW
ncbi:hypothetical protein B0H11DRAFT_2191559 [Mycena galericulata]|nr:hypothetical protein B0H11DRAFT_2191559 [Mycena galericulata]